MLCTIYFVDIGTFIGDMIPPPPNDLGVDVDEEMEEVENHGKRPNPRVQIPMGMRRRVDIRLRMELGDRICRLLVDEGVFLVTIREIQTYRMLTEL